MLEFILFTTPAILIFILYVLVRFFGSMKISLNINEIAWQKIT